MNRLSAIALAVLFAPALAEAATNAELCQSSNIKAASAFHSCRCKGEELYAKSAGSAIDIIKRDAAFGTCDSLLANAYKSAVSKYGISCPSWDDFVALGIGLSECMATGSVPSRLLKTGQKTPYGPGSDGAVQAGTSRSYTDNGDGTITDNRTGLMWEKKSWDGSVHDMTNTYTWGNGTSMGDEPPPTVVHVFLARLNSEPCFAGYCDWRLPDRTELETLVDYEVSMPATFPEFNSACTPGCSLAICSCTSSGLSPTDSTYRSSYWSSSRLILPSGIPAGFRPKGWGVNFDHGNDVASLNDTPDFHARAVRGGW